jgi:hypothetical protein
VIPNGILVTSASDAEKGLQHVLRGCCISQDFKTAHLLGVAPSAQLVAMLLGSAASVPLSVAAYMLYTSAWQVSGSLHWVSLFSNRVLHGSHKQLRCN